MKPHHNRRPQFLLCAVREVRAQWWWTRSREEKKKTKQKRRRWRWRRKRRRRKQCDLYEESNKEKSDDRRNNEPTNSYGNRIKTKFIRAERFNWKQKLHICVWLQHIFMDTKSNKLQPPNRMEERKKINRNDRISNDKRRRWRILQAINIVNVFAHLISFCFVFFLFLIFLFSSVYWCGESFIAHSKFRNVNERWWAIVEHAALATLGTDWVPYLFFSLQFFFFFEECNEWVRVGECIIHASNTEQTVPR